MTLPISLCGVGHGWDKVVFRLGEELTVRMPRRLAAVELVESEQRWLPMLAKQLPLPIPAPVWSGRPGCNYPWRWSLCVGDRIFCPVLSTEFDPGYPTAGPHRHVPRSLGSRSRKVEHDRCRIRRHTPTPGYNELRLRVPGLETNIGRPPCPVRWYPSAAPVRGRRSRIRPGSSRLHRPGDAFLRE